MARYVLTKDDVPNYQLGTLAYFFRTSVAPNHRALDDARATVDVLHGVIERMGTFGISTINQLLSAGNTFSKKRSISKPVIETAQPNL
jgi:DNA polymerase III alpha subunit (gram-positive type)